MNLCKTITAGLYLLLLSYLAGAAEVQPNKALVLASNFYYEKALMNHHQTKGQAVLKLAYTHNVSGKSIYYVFNEGEQGFIIIAADDCVYPVLGYSFSGGFTGKNMPESFIYWMDAYTSEILYIIQNQLPPDKKTSDAWNAYTAPDFVPAILKGGSKSVAPLLLSTWDQGKYYNFLCPEDPAGPGGHVWSGCVAIAMAQIMYYYRFPIQGTGSYGYNSPYGYLNANFGATTYHWENMQNSIGAKFNFEMAQLQLHCGIAIDMDYSPDGSGAYMDDAVNAMISYFSYHPTAQMRYKNSYSTTNWQNIVKGELDNKRPVLYAGYGNGGGHAFVCDGYQSSDYFHFNWGWSGSYDGYYYLNNLNPGYTFTSGQQASQNLYPAVNFPGGCTTTKALNFSYGTIEDGSSPWYDYQNNTDCRWIIEPVDPVDYISVNIDRLDTESGNDLISFYDGENITDPLIATVSGTNIPSEIRSTGNKMLVRFTSNGSNTAKGWLLTYTAKPTSFCNNLAVFTDPSGTITDGSDAFHYNNNTYCRWRIAPADIASVTIHFNSFDLASDFDFIKIYDENANLEVARFDAFNLPQTLTVYAPKVLVLFKTDATVNAGGWELSYNSTPLGTEQYSSGEFISISPNPADDYLFINGKINAEGNTSITLINFSGQKLAEKHIQINSGEIQESLNIKGLGAGMYYLLITSENYSYREKILIR